MCGHQLPATFCSNCQVNDLVVYHIIYLIFQNNLKTLSNILSPHVPQSLPHQKDQALWAERLERTGVGGSHLVRS